MSIAARFNSALHAGATLGILAFTIADDKPILAALGAGGVGVSWLLTNGKRAEHPLAVSRLVINLLVLATILNAAFRAFAGAGPGESVVSTLGQFLVFLVLIKLLDRRGPRDDAQVITLSIVVSLAATLTSAELAVGLLLVVFIPVAVATAMLWQLRAGEVMLQRAAEAGAPPGGGTVVAAVWGRHPRRGFIGVCTAAVLAGSTLATVVFLLVPRLGGEFLGRFGMTRQVMIGFNETVKLGKSGLLSEDPTPVLDMQLMGTNGENVGSSLRPQYLRGSAKDRYNTLSSTWEDGSPDSPPWTPARDGHGYFRMKETINAGFAWTLPWPDSSRAAANAARSGRTTQTITMRGETSNIFSLWRPVSILSDKQVTLTFSPTSGTIRRDQAFGPHAGYTVESVLGDDALPEPTMAPAFQFGPIREYADRLVRALPSTPSHRQIAATFRDDLQRNFLYSTEIVAPPDDRDPIEFFLLDRKKGHCEYFASALAALCQSQGIPARVVTGYLTTEFNSLTGQYTVRQSNAHAWAEVFIVTDEQQGLGRWERFDPSPQADIERIHRRPDGVLARLRGWYDALEFGWSSSFVGFDNLSANRRGEAAAERTSAQRLTAWADKAITLLRTFGTWVKSLREDPSLVPWWLKVLPVFIALLLAAAIALKRLRARLKSSPKSSLAHELGYFPQRPTGSYAKALKVLARAGEAKPDSMPPERFARDLAGRLPAAGGALQRVVALYYQSRFGGGILTATQAAEGDASVRALKAELRRAKRAAKQAPRHLGR